MGVMVLEMVYYDPSDKCGTSLPLTQYPCPFLATKRTIEPTISFSKFPNDTDVIPLILMFDISLE